MDALREIIRGIATIIIFAGFLEMLLPHNEMRRYLQVIVGLFVIVSIITPLSNLVESKKSFEVVAFQNNAQQDTKAILEKGEKIANDQQEQLQEEERKRIAAQINVLAKLQNGVQQAKVDMVEYGDNLVKVKVMLSVDKYISDKEKNILANKVKETVTAFFGFPAEQVEINF